MEKKQKDNKTKTKQSSKGLKYSVTQSLELPKEIMLNLPLLTILGTDEARLENYKNIIEFSDEKIRINTNCGILKLEGKNLIISEITSNDICITGKLLKYEFSV